VSDQKGSLGAGQGDQDANHNQKPIVPQTVQHVLGIIESRVITNHCTDNKGYNLRLYQVDLMIGQNGPVGISVAPQVLNIARGCLTRTNISKLHDDFAAWKPHATKSPNKSPLSEAIPKENEYEAGIDNGTNTQPSQ
jgi:hypothetical protein